MFLAPQVPLHPTVWAVHPDHQWLRDPNVYRYEGIQNGGPAWIAIPRPPPPFFTPFTTSAAVAIALVPWLGFEESIRLSWASSFRSPFFRTAQNAVTARRTTFRRVRCRTCPDGRIASFRCDVCQSARCEQCSRTVIARPIWTTGNAPRALVLCRQFRVQPNGFHGYRVCVPCIVFPHGFITSRSALPIDGFISA